MGVREIDQFLEQWQMDARDLHRRLVLMPTPRERALWQAQEMARHLAASPRMDGFVLGCRGRRLRDVAVLPGVPGGPGDALRAGRSGQHSGLALAAFVDQSGLSGVRVPPQAQAQGRAASYHGAAQ